ncbi:pyruvate, phosphate dikinase regulatory protein, chloroplastic-like [Panicum virgatum]|uniref:pyruvate, phosphate dikinase regulatory protein, chloroplastic-like n=1 Tax=Panicum virgatum TaxID=38727 RepID=UPI0019D5D83B|nr:pyruvate, phosphate dikinase regulatory protein, chloroplastic-like [Panicum virgatum]
MIGGAKPLAAPLLGAGPSRRLATAACAPDPSPALATAAAPSPGPSVDRAPPPRPPDEPAASPAPLRSTSQLTRWSRARALRSGRRLRLDRAAVSSAPPVTSPPPTPAPAPSLVPERAAVGAAVAEDGGDDDLCVAEREAVAGKAIYMVSDGTGWTAEHSVSAALGQFEHCLVDRRCSVSTHLFSGIDDMDRLLEVIKQAAKEGALVLYTLADPSMAEAIKKACDFWGVPCTDVLRPTVEAIAAHIGVAPSGIPRSSPSRKGQLTEDYFRRIEAIDFTIKQDDGAQPQNLNRADVVLVGVSRTGKTPLSIYLAQKGYKVANVPIVMGVNLPKALFQINQDKIFGLTINPVILQAIRKTRAKTLGFDGHTSNYAEMAHVRQELDHANQIFAQNPMWPVIGVTGKAIEETAAVVVRVYHDRKQKCSMPRISKRY